MPYNDPFAGSGLQDPVMGGYQQPVNPLNDPLMQVPISGTQMPPLLSTPATSEQLINAGNAIIQGGLTGLPIGASMAQGLKAYSDTLNETRTREEKARADRLAEYEVMGRIKERQLAELATLRKNNALDQFKQSNPEFAALAEIDPSAAVAAKIKAGEPRWETSGGTLFKIMPGQDPIAYGQNGKPIQSGGNGVSGDLNGEDYLKTLDPSFAKQVQLYAAGHLPMPSSRSRNFQQVLDAVSQYDPTFDAVNYNARAATRKAFTSGKEAATANSLNTVLGHIGSLQEKIPTLNNGKYQYLNAAGNYADKISGDPAITNYEANAKAVSDEIVKVWRASGGSEHDVEAAQKALDSSQSPEQLQGALSTYAELLHSKLDALDQQYKAGMGVAAENNKILTPKSIETLKKLGVDVADPVAPEPAAPADVAPAVPAPPAAGAGLLDQPPGVPATTPPPIGGVTVDPSQQGSIAPALNSLATSPAVAQPKIFAPKTQAEYDALPVGAKYIDPDTGKTFTKK